MRNVLIMRDVLILIIVIAMAISATFFNNRIQDLEEALAESDSLCAYLQAHESKEILLTSFNSHKHQTDGSPFITASGSRVSFQTLALSQDLIGEYIEFGDTVQIILIKNFIAEDIMNKRFKNRADAWSDNYENSKEFGIKKAFLKFKKKGD